MKQIAIPYEAKFGASATTQECPIWITIWLGKILMLLGTYPEGSSMIFEKGQFYSEP